MKNAIAISNQKGGVGKTTTAAALADGLRARGFSVLCVDMDPQGDLSFSMGAEVQDGEPSIYEALLGKAKAADLIRQTAQGDVIPSGISLAGAEVELSMTGREYKLKKALEPIAGAYDWIVIDTPPSLGILTTNAYTAAGRLIIPMQSDIFSINGMLQLYGVVKTVREYCNPELEISGLLLTRHNDRANVRKGLRESIAETAEQMGTRLFEAAIRDNVAVVESQAAQQPLKGYAPKAKATVDYESFVDEFLKGVTDHE